jgi:hypothetical protein
LIDQNIIMIGRRCNAQPRRLQSPQAIVLHLLFRMMPALTPGTPLARLCPKVSVPPQMNRQGQAGGKDRIARERIRVAVDFPQGGAGLYFGRAPPYAFRREYLTQRAPGSADLTPLRGESRSHATRETRAGSHPRS